MSSPTAFTKDSRSPGFSFSLNSSEWDYPAPERSTAQYLILSSPRSGSTMLGSALASARTAGVPAEYFHSDYLAPMGSPPPVQAVLDHLSIVRSRRTTPNGVFGMKLHAEQFKSIFVKNGQLGPEGVSFLRQFSHCILLSRNDKIEQAMSFRQALRTGLWNSALKSDAGSSQYDFVESDAPEICRLIGKFKADELFWKAVCSALKLRALEVVYEDLAAQPAVVLQRVFSFLGLPYTMEAPFTQRIAGGNITVQKAKFLKSIGA